MKKGHRFKDIYLILLSGMPGTGKTTVARILLRYLKNYTLVDQNQIRRNHGCKRMPKTFDFALREVDRIAAYNLNSGWGVIVDSVNRRLTRRHQMYGVASCCNVRVVTLEIVCSSETAKQRISERPKSDGLLSDPNDPKVYDKLRTDCDSVDNDFIHPGQDHVSYLQFNSETHKLTKKIISKGAIKFISKIKKILVESNAR